MVKEVKSRFWVVVAGWRVSLRVVEVARMQSVQDQELEGGVDQWGEVEVVLILRLHLLVEVAEEPMVVGVVLAILSI